MMLDVPPIPADLDNLDGIRWRDRMRREIATHEHWRARRHAKSLPRRDRAPPSAAVPKIFGDGEITSPLVLARNARRISSKTLFARSTPDLFPDLSPSAIMTTPIAFRVSLAPNHAKPPKLAEPHHLDDPSPFLDGTPFAGILATPLAHRNSAIASAAPITGSSRGTGAGKTNALQYFIAKDLERAVRGECSIVVLDSQRQLIEKLWSLKLFAPGQPLDGKLCLLDAADVEYPIAVNLFDMKLDRITSLVPARPREADQQRSRNV